jgi:hypothetical protein
LVAGRPKLPPSRFEALVESVHEAVVDSGDMGISRGELRSRFPWITLWRLKSILQRLSDTGVISEERQRRRTRQGGVAVQAVYRAASRQQ